jgi:hypothetical protein
MALTLTTKLVAVNTMLIGIGEAPVNTLNSGLQEAEIAGIMLDNISREVQSKGWAFNTDIRFTLTTNTDNEIVVPSNCLYVDTTLIRRDYDKDVILRNGKLYDRTQNTFTFTEAVEVDLVYLLDFETIPETARNYITLRAGRKFQENILGSPTITQLQSKDELDALLTLKDAETQSADYNVFDNYDTYRALDRGVDATKNLLSSQRILYS